MKIILEIPDRYKDKTFKVLADQELVAKKELGKDFWLVKDVSCNFCGACCMDVPNHHLPYGSDDEGKCNKLQKQPNGEWHCLAGHTKPWACLDDPSKENTPECCITYVRQEA